MIKQNETLIFILCFIMIFLLGCEKSASRPQADNKVLAEFKENAWWLPEYNTLNAALDKAGGILSCSYRSGPGGVTTVNLILERGPGKALTLIFESPPLAIKSLDGKTGHIVEHDYRTKTKFRDINLDGIPDEVLVEPAGEPLSSENITEDGYMRVRYSDDHTVIFVQWSVGIAVATNRFLHSKESVLP